MTRAPGAQLSDEQVRALVALALDRGADRDDRVQAAWLELDEWARRKEAQGHEEAVRWEREWWPSDVSEKTIELLLIRHRRWGSLSEPEFE